MVLEWKWCVQTHESKSSSSLEWQLFPTWCARGWSTPRPNHFTSWRPCIRHTGWVGAGASMDGYRIPRPQRDSILGLSGLYQDVILTMLFWLP
jgi:hypothetical protein